MFSWILNIKLNFLGKSWFQRSSPFILTIACLLPFRCIAISCAHRPLQLYSPTGLWALWCYFIERNQSTKSGLRVVAAISRGKISCWTILTSTFQLLAMARWYGDSWAFYVPLRVMLVLWWGCLFSGARNW